MEFTTFVSLPKMLEPDVYELEYRYFPWGLLMKAAADWVETNAFPSANIVDYMCGTGYLLHEISLKRRDLHLEGCSLDPYSYIEYAMKLYPEIQVVYEDAMLYKPRRPPDIILCTAGLHHLKRELQPKFIDKIAGELAAGKFFLLGEELIGHYQNEKERRFAVLELCSVLTRYVVKKDAPDNVIEAALSLFSNDIFERGEYKLSKNMVLEMLEPYFEFVDIHQVWPENPLYGDFLFLCRRKFDQSERSNKH
jgi:hypothetical protein